MLCLCAYFAQRCKYCAAGAGEDGTGTFLSLFAVYFVQKEGKHILVKTMDIKQDADSDMLQQIMSMVMQLQGKIY